MNIKSLELTENDFKLLIDGLDCLPEKNASGELFGAIFEGMLGDKNPDALEKYKRERDIKRRADEIKKEALKDEIRILQGKLLLFKRWLIEDKALKEALLGPERMAKVWKGIEKAMNEPE